jgi:hypothetical protein
MRAAQRRRPGRAHRISPAAAKHPDLAIYEPKPFKIFSLIDIVDQVLAGK